MANLIQKIVLLTLTIAITQGAAQQRRPFSHKYHLTQVATCQGCHTGAEASTSAEDNLLPFETECARCHDEVHIKEPRKTNVQKFNHSVHVGANPGPLIAAAIRSKTWLGLPEQAPKEVNTKNSCVACHHDIDKSENITEATGKANYPRMADCLVCHNQINPPESCKKCHDEAQMTLRPASHTATFGDTHSEPNKIANKAECHSCHGRKFTCKGCH